jgi:hypothetical protein
MYGIYVKIYKWIHVDMDNSISNELSIWIELNNWLVSVQQILDLIPFSGSQAHQDAMYVMMMMMITSWMYRYNKKQSIGECTANTRSNSFLSFTSTSGCYVCDDDDDDNKLNV